MFAWSFAVTLGAVMSPGPVSATVVSESARRGSATAGFRVGPLVSTGHALTEMVVVGALALGIGQVLKHPAWAVGISLLGGAFLLWMGATMAWTAVRRGASLFQQTDSTVVGAGGSLIVLGVATTLGNPFWYLWWVSVGGGYVLLALQDGLVTLGLFYLGHISADYAWNTLLASLVASGKSWLTDRIYRALLLVCGLFLVYTGLRFIWSGVGLLAA
jgi:threonine/homoserine/homoserine lactone efflux protein